MRQDGINQDQPVSDMSCTGEEGEGMKDVIRPDHYQECSIECIDVMKIAFGSDKVFWFCLMNAYKYLHRHTYKNGVEDLKKARQYISFAKEIRIQSYHLDELERMVEKYGLKAEITEGIEYQE